MLANLERSIERHLREVIVLMLWPEQADLVAQMRGARVYRQTRRHPTLCGRRMRVPVC
jgi:hypothetical protein